MIASEDYKLPHDSIFENINSDKPQNEIQKELIDDIKWLIKESSNHASIDTFAKKLYIRDDYENLIRLKNVFSAFLTLEQLLKRFDNRYDSFFAAILNDSYYEFPFNLKILSWNYDFQFEFAINKYTQSEKITSNQGTLNIITKEDTKKRIDTDKFAILKLNGTVRMLQHRGFRSFLYYDQINNPDTFNIIQRIVRNYGSKKYIESVWSGLSYAWEEERGKGSIIETAKTLTKELMSH